MPQRTLPIPQDQARELVKEAFGQTADVKKIKEKGDKIVGITKLNLTNWGNKVTVEFRDSSDGNESPIFVSGRKRFAIDVTANPEEHVERFLFNLDELVNEQTTTASTS